MKHVNLLIICLAMIEACFPGQNENMEKEDGTQILKIEFDSIEDSIKSMKVYYTENNGRLFLLYNKDTLSLGNHRGTMGMPPQIKCMKENDHILMEVTTNITQLGITLDNICLYHIGTDGKIHKDCEFEEVSQHPVEADSLSDIIHYKTYLDKGCFYLEQYQSYAAKSMHMIPQDTIFQKCEIKW